MSPSVDAQVLLRFCSMKSRTLNHRWSSKRHSCSAPGDGEGILLSSWRNFLRCCHVLDLHDWKRSSDPKTEKRVPLPLTVTVHHVTFSAQDHPSSTTTENICSIRTHYFLCRLGSVKRWFSRLCSKRSSSVVLVLQTSLQYARPLAQVVLSKGQP